jgi:hypothetical protein
VQEKKITVIITSVIAFADKQLSYSSIRSSFSPEERIRQSIATIESIRKRMPDAQVIFLEMGKKREAAPGLPALVDKYIYVGNNPLVRWACDGLHKGMGEAMGLLTARKQLRTNTDLYFKISGRYFLTEEFNPVLWNGKGFFFRKYGDNCFSTRLYGFEAGSFSQWQKAIFKSLYRLYRGKSIENVFPMFIRPELVNNIEKLGVAGFVAPDAIYLAE